MVERQQHYVLTAPYLSIEVCSGLKYFLLIFIIKAITALTILLSSAAFDAAKTKPVSTIVVSYGAISCPCAQWLIVVKSPAAGREYIYLEKGKATLPDANKLWDGESLPLKLRLQGSFKPGKGFPEGFKAAKGDPEPARVFRYTSLTIL